MFHPTFKIGDDVQRANEFLIESFLIEGLHSWFPPSLRNFMDNLIARALHIDNLLALTAASKS